MLFGMLTGTPFLVAETDCHGLSPVLEYCIIFQVKPGMLRIIAVANLHRRPGYWRNRT